MGKGRGMRELGKGGGGVGKGRGMRELGMEGG